MRPIPPPSPSVALRFDSVGFSYEEVPVLEKACFHLHRGEFAVLVGPNGAGKTTVLRLILGLADPSSGTVSVLGKSPRQARISVGYVPQHADFDRSFPVTVEEVVAMGRLGASRRSREFDRRAVDQALIQADVEDLRRRAYGALSGGQRRRVLLARALATEPEFLILDEPTANMDAESESRLNRTLAQLKTRTSILLVTHDTEFVSDLADVVLCVGDRAAGADSGRTVLRHGASSVQGRNVLRVNHELTLPDSVTCKDCGHGRAL